MKNFPRTLKFLFAIAVPFLAVLGLQALAKEKAQRDAKPVFELCITEPVVVTNKEKLLKELRKVGPNYYRIRIEGPEAVAEGDLPECTVSERTMASEGATPQGTPSAGGQATQRLKLNAKQLRTVMAYLGESMASAATPTPTPTPTPKP